LVNATKLNIILILTDFFLGPFFKSLRRKKFIAFNNNPNPYYGSKGKNVNKNNDLVNDYIRFNEVLVIAPDGESLGKMSRNDALNRAQDYNLDLVCVAPNAKPPVCKILNYGKYRYENQKKAKEARKNQKTIEVKEIQLTPQTGDHDIQTKVKSAIKFLGDGNKIKVGVRFKGRQLAHVEVGEATLNKFLELVSEKGEIDKPATLEGKWLTCYLKPKKETKK